MLDPHLLKPFVGRLWCLSGSFLLAWRLVLSLYQPQRCASEIRREPVLFATIQRPISAVDVGKVLPQSVRLHVCLRALGLKPLPTIRILTSDVVIITSMHNVRTIISILTPNKLEIHQQCLCIQETRVLQTCQLITVYYYIVVSLWYIVAILLSIHKFLLIVITNTWKDQQERTAFLAVGVVRPGRAGQTRVETLCQDAQD